MINNNISYFVYQQLILQNTIALFLVCQTCYVGQPCLIIY